MCAFEKAEIVICQKVLFPFLRPLFGIINELICSGLLKNCWNHLEMMSDGPERGQELIRRLQEVPCNLQLFGQEEQAFVWDKILEPSLYSSDSVFALSGQLVQNALLEWIPASSEIATKFVVALSCRIKERQGNSSSGMDPLQMLRICEIFVRTHQTLTYSPSSLISDLVSSGDPRLSGPALGFLLGHFPDVLAELLREAPLQVCVDSNPI